MSDTRDNPSSAVQLAEMKLLVANRGEIARRVLRTARRLGMSTVAVYADPDATAPFVNEADVAIRIGPADLASSYLSSEAVLRAAATAGATAIHPGYGFLSENGDFARAVVDAGLVWVGPNPDAIDVMGLKTDARRLADEHNVPIIPGFDSSQHDDDLIAAAKEIGFPVLIKAAAGGGGRGIRIVHARSGFESALSEARSEAERSFGNGDVIVERFITRPRHVEVQLIGDRHGTVVDLGTRECSVQRRYQKLIEEAPAPNLADETRRGLRDRARALGQAIGYDSAGTVEFIVDDETGDFFFLEMNTRLQVEHPVTEYVTGLDLVELQLRSAAGEELDQRLADVQLTGHAFEARIVAEDPADGFSPQTGTITNLAVPQGVRWDSAIELGSTISPHYDSMIAKLIVGAEDRAGALAQLESALEQLVVGGLATNTGFHRWLIDSPEFRSGRITTRFLDDNPPPPLAVSAEDAARAAASALLAHRRERAASDVWSQRPDFRLTPTGSSQQIYLRHHNGSVVEVPVADLALSGTGVALVSAQAGSVAVNLTGTNHSFTVLSRAEMWAVAPTSSEAAGVTITAPFPAVVAEVPVAPGQTVEGGQTVIVVEAMKMLHSLAAPGPGVIADIPVAVGDQVDTGQVLVSFAEEADDDPDTSANDSTGG